MQADQDSHFLIHIKNEFEIAPGPLNWLEFRSSNSGNITGWVKVFRIIPEFRILRLTFHRIRQITVAFLIYSQFI